MKQLISLALAAATAFGMVAQSKQHQISIGDFNELKVVGNVNVDYVVSADSAGMVCFVAEPSVAPAIEVSNKKGRLRVDVKDKDGKALNGVELPTVTVYSNSLLKAENEGDSTLRVLSVVTAPNFSARLIGNGALVVREVKATSVDCSLLAGHGRMIVYGNCKDAKFNLAGTGIIQADGLETVNATCFATGTGEIGVNAEHLKVGGAGSATIYYLGKPEITKSLAIGVKILPLEPDPDHSGE